MDISDKFLKLDLHTVFTYLPKGNSRWNTLKNVESYLAGTFLDERISVRILTPQEGSLLVVANHRSNNPVAILASIHEEFTSGVGKHSSLVVYNCFTNFILLDLEISKILPD